jgi:hypothetical protein
MNQGLILTESQYLPSEAIALSHSQINSVSEDMLFSIFVLSIKHFDTEHMQVTQL